MFIVNIHLSDSDVAMLQVAVLLATSKFDLVYTPVKSRSLICNACNCHHSPVSAWWHEGYSTALLVKTWQQHQP